MNAKLTFLCALTLAACSGSQPGSSDVEAADVAATGTPTTAGEAAPTSSAAPVATATASAAATVDHAPGGAHCNELAKTCHDVGHGADAAGKCHQIGHAGDAAVCEKEHARCLDVCKKAATKGGADHGKGHHAP